MSDPKFPEADSPDPIEELEDAYSVEYLQECADGEAREERLQELKRRIALGAYQIDADTVAQELLSRGDLESD